MKKLVFVLFIAFAFSCSKEADLSDSIYIYDSEFPDLPAYTEWGYNTFGANYDRGVFVYSSNEIPLKVTTKDNKLTFIFQGIDGNYSNNDLALKFIISDSNVNVYKDLLVYNDSVIDLSSQEVEVQMVTEGVSETIDVLEGELYFKRSQNVFVDDIEYEIILSGKFNLKFIENEIPSNISDGRFDFGINDDNFYNLN